MHKVFMEIARSRELFRRWRDRTGHGPGAPLEAFRSRFYAELWERAAHAVGARVEALEDEVLRIRRGAEWTLVRRFDVLLDSRLALHVAGHKLLGHRLLSEAGLPVPAHRAFRAKGADEAWSWLASTGRPGVVKPASGGSAGRGVTTGIATQSAFRRAVARAAAHGGELLVETQVEGASFRLLFLRGAYVDAVMRASPALEGDGTSRIRDLIHAENRARGAGERLAFHPLTIDLELTSTLAAQGLRLKSVPAAGRRFPVKRAVNQGSAADAECVRERIHPEWIEIGRRAAAALRLEWAGVDLITPDASLPPGDGGGVVNEVNSTPALHHHLLVRNPEASEPIAERLLDTLLESAPPHGVPTPPLEASQ